MSNYEAAPATQLLATHCCLCGRPLVDAESVECGIGPTCAKRAGANKPDRQPDWFQVAIVAGATDVAASLTKAIESQDAHRAANILVHAIGADTDNSRVPHLIAAVDALGYHRLAERLAEAVRPVVRVVPENDVLVVETNRYVASFVTALQRVPGRRWDRERKVNTVPTSQRAALWAAIRASMAGDMLVANDTVRVIAAVG